MKKIWIFAIILIAVGAFWYVLLPKQISSPAIETAPAENTEIAFAKIDFAKIDPVWRFSGNVPENIEIGSDIFITTFQASDFLTLKTVTIHQQEKTTINGHEAVLYEIEKKPEAPDFSNQPSWRNKRHIAIDVRFSKINPTIFYSFAFRPELKQELTADFLESIVFHNDIRSIMPALPRLEERIIKKPFQMYITPQNSPVQPEFFTGYHTGVDYEIFTEEEAASVPVFALCGGELKLARGASGYGGVAVQECLFEDLPVTVVYGHLLESSLRQIGSYLSPGDIVGNLAPAGPEAGGGRKHLHLGIHRSNMIDIRGYVSAKEELANWLDPALYQL